MKSKVNLLVYPHEQKKAGKNLLKNDLKFKKGSINPNNHHSVELVIFSSQGVSFNLDGFLALAKEARFRKVACRNGFS